MFFFSFLFCSLRSLAFFFLLFSLVNEEEIDIVAATANDEHSMCASCRCMNENIYIKVYMRTHCSAHVCIIQNCFRFSFICTATLDIHYSLCHSTYIWFVRLCVFRMVCMKFHDVWFFSFIFFFWNTASAPFTLIRSLTHSFGGFVHSLTLLLGSSHRDQPRIYVYS